MGDSNPKLRASFWSSLRGSCGVATAKAGRLRTEHVGRRSSISLELQSSVILGKKILWELEGSGIVPLRKYSVPGCFLHLSQDCVEVAGADWGKTGQGMEGKPPPFETHEI